MPFSACKESRGCPLYIADVKLGWPLFSRRGEGGGGKEGVGISVDGSGTQRQCTAPETRRVIDKYPPPPPLPSPLSHPLSPSTPLSRPFIYPYPTPSPASHLHIVASTLKKCLFHLSGGSARGETVRWWFSRVLCTWRHPGGKHRVTDERPGGETGIFVQVV